ncbi:Clp protease N-terminal domain-containing protein [Streptomyces sp. NPDC002888]|uniref:Clp protease N-terminal domain-containing protein n=1 Tax=Streptomyces sp. NPDC002888 TaxID=3364668 RepID=UPI0036B864EB
MQPRIPRQSAHDHGLRPQGPGDQGPDDLGPGDQGPRGADFGTGLGDELAAVLGAARRRAVRDGDRQIDTAHLLHSLLEYDPETRAVIDDDGAQIARLLGYLVQRSIGYGLRWQGSVEDSGGVPVVTEVEGFSPLAAAALADARTRAAHRGDAPVGGLDLLAALVADPQARAVEVLARAGVDARRLSARIERRPQEYAAGGESGH